MINVYIPCRSKKEAQKVSRHLLRKRLIGCANIFPTESTYWWENKIVEDKESVIIAKTQKMNYIKIIKEVEEIHSYDIPLVECWNAKSNKKYQDWLKKTITGIK